ncbi:MAG TPA: tetratricopeptide repeat protein [Longimicrobium sp.]
MRKFIGFTIALLVAALLAGSSAAAQIPDRPALPVGADPNDWNAYFDRGVRLLGEDSRAADEMFRWASRLDPSRAEPLYGRWVAFHMLDARRFADYVNDDERVRRDRGVLAADSLYMAALVRNPFVHRGLAALAYQQLPGEWAGDAFTQAFLEYARGNLDAAARRLAQVVQRSPRNFRARYALALSLVHLRRYDEARVELDSVLAVLRRREERNVVRVYESKEMLMYSLGLLHLVQNRHEQAREAFAQAVLEDASQWYAHRGLALALAAGGRPDEALPEYRTAIELAGDDPVLLSEYGKALAAAGQYAAAVEQLSRLVRITPEWADAWLALGNAEVRAGRNADAVEAFTAYLARAPRSDAAGAERVRTLLGQLRAGTD